MSRTGNMSLCFMAQFINKQWAYFTYYYASLNIRENKSLYVFCDRIFFTDRCRWTNFTSRDRCPICQTTAPQSKGCICAAVEVTQVCFLTGDGMIHWRCFFLTSNFFWGGVVGGGVMGAPGWNAALAVMADLKHQWNTNTSTFDGGCVLLCLNK